MIHKAIKSSPIIATRTTPTVKAVEIAKKYGVAIVGYLKVNNFRSLAFRNDQFK